MKKKIIVIAILVICIMLGLTLVGTFASSETSIGEGNVYNITLIGNNGEIVVPAGSSKTVMYQITNTNKGTVQYGVAYSGNNITVKVWNNSQDSHAGTIDYGENKFIKLYIENTGTTESAASIKTVLGYEFGGSLDSLLPSGYTFVSVVYTSPVNLVSYINNLYSNAAKTVVTNNGIGYNYASSVNLMNDRLGGTTRDYDAGNIRYYGHGITTNNYIDIGDRDSSGNIILYRIIGVFKDIELEDGSKEDLIKVIRAASLGTYAWDNKLSGLGSSISNDGSNDWTDARLMMLLNPGYEDGANDTNGNTIYEYEGSLWWNSKSGNCYPKSSSGPKTCDFTSIGLSKTVHDKIETVVWNLGGWNTEEVYPNEIYGYERGTTVYTGRLTKWTGKIALMYLSDYGYAVDLSKCNLTLAKYPTSSGCSNYYNWLMYNQYQWTVTPYSSYNSVMNIESWNSAYESYFFAEEEWVVRPVFYLDSKLSIISGSGASTDPYVIG